MRFLIVVLAIASVLASCGGKVKDSSGRLAVVATTGMIADAVKIITDGKVEVIALMGPGVDPHLYKPTPHDVDKISRADIVVYNGLHLEGKMGEILHKISHKKKVIAVSAGIDKSKLIIANPDMVSKGKEVVYDPHIWFDVSLWKDAIEYMSLELQKADTANALLYKKNTEAYIQKLVDLHKETAENIQTIPKEGRVLITAHDAFSYFGKAYDIEVMGLQGISTVSEPGLHDISSLVELIASRKIKAVFIESSVSVKAINAVVEGSTKKGHNVKIGGTLYSDAMGAEGTPEGTYIGMVKANVKTMVEGLK